MAGRFLRALTLALVCPWWAFAGCADGQGPRPAQAPSTWEPVSGSRLTARFLTGEDGSRIFDGWFDTERGEFCRVARGQNGRYYCFPSSNPVVYGDARCQQAMGQHLECAFRYTGISRGDRRCGNETLSLWEEGAPISPPARYRFANDFCAGPDTSDGGRFVSLAARVPDSALAAGDPRLGPAALRLRPRLVRFEDGAEAPIELWDSSGNRSCVRVETVQGTRCLPENAVYVGLAGPYYAEETCSERVAHAYAPACLRPAVALVAETVNGCMRVREAYLPGQRLDPRMVYSGGDCQTGAIIPGHFYQLGTRLDLTSFPELRLHETGKGRIRLRTYSAADDISIAPLGQNLFDSKLGIECKIAVASDGVLRCLPLTGPALIEGEAAAAAFADAGCRHPLARYNATTSCAGGSIAAVGMVARASQKKCLEPEATGPGSRDDRQPGRWDIFRVGPRHEGEVYFRVGGVCQAGPPASGDEFYEMAETVAPDTFVAFRQADKN
jgi:hypothetical protein